MKLITLLTLVFSLASCTPQLAERKPVPPPGSDASNMPWNTPNAGEGGGALGAMLNQQQY